jgi:hypothetical protein
VDASQFDAGSFDAGSDLAKPDSVQPQPDVPAKNLFDKPVPFALSKSKDPYSHSCFVGTPENSEDVSTCVYLKGIYTIDGDPIPVSSYTHLVTQLDNIGAGQYLYAEFSGNAGSPSNVFDKKIAVERRYWQSIGTSAHPRVVVGSTTKELYFLFHHQETYADQKLYDCNLIYTAPNASAECSN